MNQVWVKSDRNGPQKVGKRTPLNRLTSLRFGVLLHFLFFWERVSATTFEQFTSDARRLSLFKVSTDRPVTAFPWNGVVSIFFRYPITLLADFCPTLAGN